MAVTLKKSISIDIGSLVSSAIEVVRIEKAKESARVESEFQKAVADGTMSYEAQLTFRQNQLDEEKSSTIVDEDIVNDLTSSIKDLKKYARFERYRTKYNTSFADLKAGRITAQQQLDMLRSELNQATDPDLQLEIQGEITTAEADVKTYEDAILANQVTRARNDGTPALLNDAISKVQDKRALAALKGNDEEVTAYDNTLTVLQQQLNKATIENTMNDIEIRNISKNLGAFDKIETLNQEINSADGTAPVVINGTRYDSAKQYWTFIRDSYLNGSGTGLFSNFFNELSDSYTEKINAAVRRDGYATTLTLDSIKNDFANIGTKPELAAYADKLNNLQASALGYAFESTAKTIIDRASYTGDFKDADTSLQSYAKRYGIDAEGYRLQLGQQMVSQISSTASATGKSAEEIAKEAGVEKTLLPGEFPIPGAKPATPATPITPTAPAVSPTGTRVVAKGENLGIVAREAGVSLNQLLEWNPEYKTNPNFVKEGAVIKTAAPTTPPATPVTPTPEVKPTETPPKVSQPVAPQTPTPEKTVTPKVVVVAKNETLSAIAQRELGDASRWRELKSESGQTYDEATAKLLQPGTRLIIPQ